MKQQLIILRGLPGSGKSTWAKTQCLHDNNIVVINRDKIRLMLRPTEDWYQLEDRKVLENIVSNIVEKSIIYALLSGKTVISDACHIVTEHLKIYDDIIRYVHIQNPDLNVEKKIVNMITSLEDCIEKDSKRIGFDQVGKDVILRMNKQFKK